MSYPDFEDVRDGTAEAFSDIAASHFVPLTIDRGEGGGVGLAPAEAVTGSYFPMLGIEAAVGRTLLPSDDVSRAGHPVVMLDYRYWKNAFAGDPEVVGHKMRVGGRAYTVIGAGPPDFAGTVRGLTPTFYVPYMMAEEEGFETRYRRAMTQRVQRFDGDGEVTDDETLLYQVEPCQGALFSRLTARDGEPIDAGGRREQERHWEEFQAEIDDPGKRAEREREAEENEIKFDEELVGRFTARLDGVRDLRGRPSYVISFEPRPGKLPVRRRIDHALNKSRGEVWIDTETYEIAQISFQLMDRVRLWWGIIGSISDATGRLERRPVAGDGWLDTEFEVYFHVRVLFRTTRRNTTTQWSEFELAD